MSGRRLRARLSTRDTVFRHDRDPRPLGAAEGLARLRVAWDLQDTTARRRILTGMAQTTEGRWILCGVLECLSLAVEPFPEEGRSVAELTAGRPR